MDTFFEQIIAVRKDTKALISIAGIWVGFFVLAAALWFLINVIPVFSTVILFGIVLLGYLAFKLTKKFSIEYEYIITNGCFDVDKIIAKSSRKRMMTFEISTVPGRSSCPGRGDPAIPAGAGHPLPPGCPEHNSIPRP